MKRYTYNEKYALRYKHQREISLHPLTGRANDVLLITFPHSSLCKCSINWKKKHLLHKNNVRKIKKMIRLPSREFQTSPNCEAWKEEMS